MRRNLGEEHLHGMLHLLFITFILVYLIILLDIELEDMSMGIRKLINILTCLYRCDHILSYGKGTRLLSYKRAELMLSDHRPVTAVYMAEVGVVCPRRLQRALTFSNAEVEDHLLSRKEAHLEPKTIEPWARQFPSSSLNQDDAMQCNANAWSLNLPERFNCIA